MRGLGGEVGPPLQARLGLGSLFLFLSAAGRVLVFGGR